jgi:hypothetical protein
MEAHSHKVGHIDFKVFKTVYILFLIFSMGVTHWDNVKLNSLIGRAYAREIRYMMCFSKKKKEKKILMCSIKNTNFIAL